jgi:ATP-dependent Lhr-like helicase
MINPAEVAAIRRSLPAAWAPFFARFGRLTPIQLLAIPRVLAGANVVLASPTASGKTEAVVAPVAEQLVADGWTGLSVLYVVPTRALANDALERIQGPLEDMGIRATLKHGDRPHLPRELPGCLITTPESLDSLICRRPGIFGTLRAVILDEIHLLDNTYRGDQLRVLLSRLWRLNTHGGFSVHALSATLSDPQAIGHRYSTAFEVIVSEGQRPIDFHVVGSAGELFQLAREHGWRKVLCFCNYRKSVEALASSLEELWKPYPVVAHHGSLERRERETAEAVMKEASVAVCVATSTLEVGIDIGDINAVVLAEVPWSISSMLQRIGRGNRREEAAHVVGIATSEAERMTLEAMLSAASSGILPVETYQPDLSVAVQQVLSYLFAHPQGVPEPEVADVLSPLCSLEQAQRVLRHLQDREWAEWRVGCWCPSSKLMDEGEKGHIHSNIPDSPSYRVVDAGSGRDVGTIAGSFDSAFCLSGTSWRVVSVVGSVVMVVHARGGAPAPAFSRRRNVGAFYHLLPAELRGAEG